jgi:hypothetical protein
MKHKAESPVQQARCHILQDCLAQLALFYMVIQHTQLEQHNYHVGTQVTR